MSTLVFWPKYLQKNNWNNTPLVIFTILLSLLSLFTNVIPDFTNFKCPIAEYENRNQCTQKEIACKPDLRHFRCLPKPVVLIGLMKSSWQQACWLVQSKPQGQGHKGPKRPFVHHQLHSPEYIVESTLYSVGCLFCWPLRTSILAIRMLITVYLVTFSFLF